MHAWLNALLACDHDAVLVTVAATQGSVPRAAGTHMLVTAAAAIDTIGGGHLEWRALQIARQMLTGDAGLAQNRRRLERLALGASLGQCCGGVVQLAFERIAPRAHAPFVEIAARLARGDHVRRRVDLGAPDTSAKLLSNATACATTLQDTWFDDVIDAVRARVILFGAGHVGQALVRVLGQVPCHIDWVDEREDLFPAVLPGNVHIEATDAPEALLRRTDENTDLLVMTHSHALDLRLSEAILRHSRFGWFGLIGSQTKRRAFLMRLRERGIDDAQLARICCPIGLPGLAGKEPGTIAVAVAAQLLLRWQAHDDDRQTASQAQPAPSTPDT